MKRIFFCFFFLFIFYCSGFAGKITGTVTDKQGNQPLSFASISVKGTTKGINANNDGVFVLELTPGNYTLICQHVGYKKEERNITVTDADMVVDFSLEIEEKGLEEIVVSAPSDKAYQIMREAIATREAHYNEVDKFTCQVYTKGNLKVRSYPKKILGQKIDFGDGDADTDTSKQKMIYLSESISNYTVDKPDKEKIEVISTKVSGRPNDYGLSAPQFFSFYQENVFIGGRENALNQRGFVSPLADNAISYYKFRFKGTFIEDGILINKIQVLPRRKYEPLFTGFINIVENDWHIHSLELTLTKESQIELLDTLKIQQLYVHGSNDRWMVKNQVLYPAIKILGVDAHGSFLNVYSNFNFNPSLTKKDFTSTLLKVTDSATKKTTGYWETARPVPLMEDELHDYKVKDSMDIVKQGKRYIDSMDKVSSKLSVFNMLFSGVTFVTTPKRISLQFQPIPEILSYNIVEGIVLNTGFDWTKRLDENPYSKRKITLSPNIRYGFLNKHFYAHLTTRYNFGTKYHSSAMLSGGKRVFQFNNKINIGPRRNTLATLFSRRNLLLFYEAWYLRGSYSQGIGNGFNWTVGFQYQDRMPLENSTDYSFYNKGDREFTPNYPVELMSENIQRHQMLTFLYRLSWQPKSKYIELPEGKINLGSKYPVFDLQIEGAFNGLLGTDGDFSKWKFSVKDDINFKLQGKFSYHVGAGGFVNANNVQVPDYSHFIGNISRFASDYLTSFQLLPMYQFSNIEKFYTYGHIEHAFNGFITNKIPIIRKLNWHLIAAANGFYHKNANFYELSAGLENINIGKIVRGVRVDFIQSFLNGKSWTTGFRVGIGRRIAKQRDDYP